MNTVPRFQSKASHRWLRLIAQVWTILCGLYFLWEAVSYRGLFARLAEWQIARFGTYVPLLTYLLLLGLAVVPVWIIIRFLMRRAEEDLDAEAVLELRIAQARRLRLLLVGLGVTSLSIAAGFVVFAVWMLPGQSGQLQTISSAEFGTISISEGPARIVGGELGTVIYFGQDWFIGDDRMAFSPYRPSTPGKGAAQVFVQLEATSKNELERIVQRPSWSGILVEGGLPGPVRVLFNDIGIGIAAQHYTLYQNEYALKIRYWLQAVQWALLTVFMVLLVALQSRAIRKLEKQRNAPVA